MFFSVIPTQFRCWIQILCVMSCYQGWGRKQQMNVRADTASVQPQQILVNHHFTTSTSYLNTILNSEGKSMPRVLQNMHAYSIQSSIRKRKAGSEDVFHQLQYAKLIALAETLAGPERRMWALSSMSRVVISNSYHSRGWAKPRIREDASCPASPSPTGLTLHTQSPDPRTWRGRGCRAAPAPGAGPGHGKAMHGCPTTPACSPPAPRKGPAASGRVLQPGRDGERREGKAGLGLAKPAARTRSGETLPSWGDRSHGPSQQLRKEIREERTRNGSTGLLTHIQALLQPLLFPESKRQIVRRARTRLPHCNVHKKKGGAQKRAASDPSASPFPQRD